MVSEMVSEHESYRDDQRWQRLNGTAEGFFPIEPGGRSTATCNEPQDLFVRARRKRAVELFIAWEMKGGDVE